MEEKFASDAIRGAILTLAREIGRLERENASLRSELAAATRERRSGDAPARRQMPPINQSRARLLHREKP